MSAIKNMISKFFFQLRVKKMQQAEGREKRFMSYDDIRTVLILFESEFTEKNEIIRKLVKKLSVDGKKVSTCGFIKKKQTKSAILPDSRILDLSHTSFLEKPQDAIVSDLLNQEYDMVMDLTLDDLIPLMYVLINAKSPFKVGRKRDELNLLDFALDLKKIKEQEHSEEISIKIDEDYLFHQIIFYLKNIKSNN